MPSRSNAPMTGRSTSTTILRSAISLGLAMSAHGVGKVFSVVQLNKKFVDCVRREFRMNPGDCPFGILHHFGGQLKRYLSALRRRLLAEPLKLQFFYFESGVIGNGHRRFPR